MTVTNPKTFQACLARRREFLSARDAMAYDAGVKMHSAGETCPPYYSPEQNGWMDADADGLDATSERIVGHDQDIGTAVWIAITLTLAIMLIVACIAFIAGREI